MRFWLLRFKLFLALLFTSTALRAADYGTFVLVKGAVQVEYSNGQIDQAKVSAKVSVGDTIITAEESRAKVVVFGTRNILNILPNTKLKIMQIAENSETKTIQLNLIDGKVRANVGDKFNGSSRFQINTTTGVVGVRGTQFIVSYSAATKITEVLTIRGAVSFFSKVSNSSSGLLGAEVIVGRGQKSSVGVDAVPTVPVKVDSQEFRQIESDTSIEKDANMAPTESDAGKTAESASDESGGFININPIATPNTFPVNGIGVPQRRNTPVNINIK